ncbi:hypothetical protein HBB16_13730, partial [Pseudonocardia sp. MCCB 268]|nr:hypothetical protein [Pseudonocardia cytotoxica]
LYFRSGYVLLKVKQTTTNGIDSTCTTRRARWIDRAYREALDAGA